MTPFRRKGRRGWHLKYKDASGRWRTRTFRTREAAEDERIRLRTSPDSGDRRTLAQYADDWLGSLKLHARPGTIRLYRWAMTKHLLPHLGTVKLRDLTRVQVRSLPDRLLSAGLTRRTTVGVLGILESCLQAAVQDGLMFLNPATGQWRTRALVRTERREETEAFDADQLRRFLGTAYAVAPDYYLRFRVMALTGLRLGEVLGLQWSDLDLACRTARIRRGVGPSGVQPTKTGRSRTVDLAAGLSADLTAWDAESKAIALQRGRERAPWVFPAKRGGPGQHRETERAFKRTLAAAGLPPHHTPHSLRHTYASLQLVRGISPLYVQRQLGHASLKMTTEVYGRWLPMGDAAAADGLEAHVARLSPRNEHERHGF